MNDWFWIELVFTTGELGYVGTRSQVLLLPTKAQAAAKEASCAGLSVMEDGTLIIAQRRIKLSRVRRGTDEILWETLYDDEGNVVKGGE